MATTPPSPPPGAPDLVAAAAALSDFCVTVAHLRDPKTGCPWDLEQNHETLRRYMLEEAYEAAEAMAEGAAQPICDELGDVLLQVVLNAQIALDAGHFSLTDVIRGIDAKMRRRHPHVFGGGGGEASKAEVRRNWDVIKAAERGSTQETRLFAEAEKKSPASLQAEKIGKIAAAVRFDWDSPAEVLAQVRSEVDELDAELRRNDSAKIAEELGDIYFSLAQLCRHLNLSPEVVALDANSKFLRRFAQLEDLAAASGVGIKNATRDQLEALWREVKRLEGG